MSKNTMKIDKDTNTKEWKRKALLIEYKNKIKKKCKYHELKRKIVVYLFIFEAIFEKYD